MTKLRALTSITAVLAFAAALAGCPMDNDEGIIPAPLPAPQASLYGSLLSWPAVPGAGGYTVHAGDLRENIPAAGAGARQTDLAGLGLPVGEHGVAVVALGVEGRSLDSPPSEPLSFTVNCPDCGNYPCGCGDTPSRLKSNTTAPQSPESVSPRRATSRTTFRRNNPKRCRRGLTQSAISLPRWTRTHWPGTDSLTVSIHPIEGGRIVGLNEENKAVIYTDSTSADGIMADLAYGRDMARAAQAGERDNTIAEEATNINIDGINFHIAGGLLTYGQIRAIEDMLGGLDASAFAGYVYSVELAGIEGFDVELTGQGQGIRAGITIEYRAGAAAIMAALEYARTQVLAEREAACNALIIDAPTDIARGNIDFRISGGLTRGQVNAITAVINGIAVTQLDPLADYIGQVMLERGVANGWDINAGTGENARATVRIESVPSANEVVNAITVIDALGDAQGQTSGVRDAARADREAQEYRAFRDANPIYSGPITRGGITFRLGTGVDGSAAAGAANSAQLRAQIGAITATIAGLNNQLGAFAGYITNVTFSNVAGPEATFAGAGVNTTATIEVPYGITAAELLAFLGQTQSEVEELRTPDTNGPTEFLSLSFEGRTTVLKAVAGINQATLDAIYADTRNGFDNIADDGNRRSITNRLASWTLTDEHIDSGWRIIGYDNNRAIVESNTSGLDFAVIIELITIGEWVSANPDHANQFSAIIQAAIIAQAQAMR